MKPVQLAELENELWVEAVKTIPGVLAAWENDDCIGQAMLLNEYHLFAKERGISDARSWQLLWMASMHWNKQAVASLVQVNGSDAATTLRKMALSTAVWASDK